MNVGALDQAAAGARDLAVMVRMVYDAFRKEGFTEEEALRFAGIWMTTLRQPDPT